MAITFTSLMIGNFLAPPFIKVAGSKWCIAFSSLCKTFVSPFLPKLFRFSNLVDWLRNYEYLLFYIDSNYWRNHLRRWETLLDYGNQLNCSHVGSNGRVHCPEFERRRGREEYRPGVAHLHVQVSIQLFI